MKNILITLFLLWSMSSQAQLLDTYQVSLAEKSISGFDGLQSFVFGQDNGNWLLIGGRTDGLHRRQPPFSFLAADNNTTIYVINPVQSQVWSASLSSLSTALQEQLQSTNMEFYQRGSSLYILGGYGFSTTANDHITYDKLTAVNVPGVINAIKNNQPITTFFRQITTPYVQETGGQLGYMDSVFYLVGGQKFTGRYNPMNGPSFVQEYSHQVRKFKIFDNGTALSITDTNSVTDVSNFRRRDYNMLPQIYNNGAKGFTIFSGVFQPTVDLPFLNMVDITATNHAVNNSISLHYNHYHCAKVAMYDSVNNVSENIFFGGISQYYDSAGTLVQDDNVPFVNTIGAVVRNAQGNLLEKKIGELPLLLGASSEFIPNETIARYENEIVKSENITGDSILLGHIVGGIESSQKNIFFINTGTESDASSRIFEVWLKKKSANSVKNTQQESSFFGQIQFYPNPSNSSLNMKYFVKKSGEMSLTISNIQGAALYREQWVNDQVGWQTENFDVQLAPGQYSIRVLDENNKTYSQLFIVSE